MIFEMSRSCCRCRFVNGFPKLVIVLESGKKAYEIVDHIHFFQKLLAHFRKLNYTELFLNFTVPEFYFHRCLNQMAHSLQIDFSLLLEHIIYSKNERTIYL